MTKEEKEKNIRKEIKNFTKDLDECSHAVVQYTKLLDIKNTYIVSPGNFKKEIGALEEICSGYEFVYGLLISRLDNYKIAINIEANVDEEVLRIKKDI